MNEFECNTTMTKAFEPNAGKVQSNLRSNKVDLGKVNENILQKNKNKKKQKKTKNRMDKV